MCAFGKKKRLITLSKVDYKFTIAPFFFDY